METREAQLRSSTIKTSGGMNLLFVLLSHIPCCGSKIFIALFGMQLLGNFAVDKLYKFQFIMPIVISSLVTLVAVLMNKKCANHTCCELHQHNPNWRHNALSLFLSNIVVGYVIVSMLYLFIPPHSHHKLDVTAKAQVSDDGKFVAVNYFDSNLMFPWADRMFVAERSHVKNAKSKAEEIYWYQKLYLGNMASFTGNKKAIKVNLRTCAETHDEHEHEHEHGHEDEAICIQGL